MSKTNSFIEKMKKNLLARKVELQAILTGSNQIVNDTQVKDSGDEALTASMDNLQSSLTHTEVEELNEINSALSRIEHNEYGLCIDCGETIAEKRLEHSPFSARCIVCQEELEQHQP
ncbi:MAG: DnaK suppressor protein [Candidatus Dependentiae bacterium]|nr:DnaK suppressor protein [Candidatus Dependentiae bacterium]